MGGASRSSWLVKEMGSLGQISTVDLANPDWLELAATMCEGPDGRGGADAVVDGVGGPLLVQIAERLIRPRGAVLRYGSVSGPPDEDALATALEARALRVISVGVDGALA